MSNPTAKRPTKNERRELARQQAKQAREAQIKKDKRNRVLLQGGIALAIVAVLAIIGLVLMQVLKPAGPGPKNMASGGVVFEGPEFSVQETPTVNDGEQLVPQTVDRLAPPLDIVVYVDYMCPACGAFEEEAGPMLEQWVGSGQATLQVYPMNFQDNASAGTKYSTRSANLLSCVVEQQPEAAWNLHAKLLSPETQPTQGEAGLTNKELLEVATETGVDVDDQLTTCVEDVRFADFVTKTTNQALSGPLVGLAVGAQLSDGSGGLQDGGEPQRITGTPSVIVNGLPAPTSAAELEQFMLKMFADLTEEPSDEDESDESTEDSGSEEAS